MDIVKVETDPLRIETHRANSAWVKAMRELHGCDDPEAAAILYVKAAAARADYLTAVNAVVAAPRPRVDHSREPEAPEEPMLDEEE